MISHESPHISRSVSSQTGKIFQKYFSFPVCVLTDRKNLFASPVCVPISLVCVLTDQNTLRYKNSPRSVSLLN